MGSPNPLNKSHLKPNKSKLGFTPTPGCPVITRKTTNILSSGSLITKSSFSTRQHPGGPWIAPTFNHLIQTSEQNTNQSNQILCLQGGPLPVIMELWGPYKWPSPLFQWSYGPLFLTGFSGVHLVLQFCVYHFPTGFVRWVHR